MPNRVLRVGLDCRLAGQRHAGIGRYTQNLVRELIQLPNQFTWVVFFSDKPQADQVLGELSQKYSSSIEIVIASSRHYSLREQLRMPHLLNQKRLDLLHVPHFNVPLLYKGKVVVTIHDLLWHEYRGADVTTLPKWQYWAKYAMYRLTVTKAVEKAKMILVPAQTVAGQVVHYYPEAKKRIVVTPEGVSAEFFARKAAVKPQKYFVYLGSLYPHKNVQIVIKALRELPEYSLRIISSRNVFQTRLEKEVRADGLNSRVEFLGYQTDEEVQTLLGNATALVQPSLSEGFGLTGLEAMAAGTPVLASDIPIFHEVYEKHAFFFEPKSTASFIEAVQRLENAPRAAHIAAATTFVKKYQWKKMAEETLAVYNNVLTTTP